MLELLPIIDSDELADARRRELSISYDRAAELGRTAVDASRTGHYATRDGESVDIRNEVADAIRSRTSIPPDAPLPSLGSERHSVTRVQVSNETTFGAARRLVSRGRRPLALNFANGVHPGGGFLNGARAQEEVLCRSSALCDARGRRDVFGTPRTTAPGFN